MEMPGLFMILWPGTFWQAFQVRRINMPPRNSLSKLSPLLEEQHTALCVCSFIKRLDLKGVRVAASVLAAHYAMPCHDNLDQGGRVACAVTRHGCKAQSYGQITRAFRFALDMCVPASFTDLAIQTLHNSSPLPQIQCHSVWCQVTVGFRRARPR